MEKRRAFLIRFLALPFAGVLLARFLAACGTSTDEEVTGCAAGVVASTSGSHIHTVSITRDDIVAGAQKTYTVTDNGNAHTHTVVVTAAQFADLASNTSVLLTTSLESAHDHQIVISCS